jgi:Fic family protein
VWSKLDAGPQTNQKQDNGDITPWLLWFLSCLDRAFIGAQTTLASVLVKAKFWDAHSNANFNERQRDMINRLFNDLEGKLNTSKWAKIEKCSADTALRDITDLTEHAILKKEASGDRSTSYVLRNP